jgi:hypothetical protein
LLFFNKILVQLEQKTFFIERSRLYFFKLKQSQKRGLMRFIVFLLFFSVQIVNASLNEKPVDTGPIITKGMREIAFDVNLTTCPKDTAEGGVLYFRGGYTLNQIMGGFEVGTIPNFDTMEPMPFETLFSLLLHGTTTHPVDFHSNIMTGIESALEQLSPESHRSPELFFIRTPIQL